MKIKILDDTFDTLRTLPCFRELAGHDVTIWNDHIDDLDALAARLRDTEVPVLIRAVPNQPRPLRRALHERGAITSAAGALPPGGVAAPPKLSAPQLLPGARRRVPLAA